MTTGHVIAVLGGLWMVLGAWWIATPALALAFYGKLYRRPMRLTPRQLRMYGVLALLVGGFVLFRYGLGIGA